MILVFENENIQHFKSKSLKASKRGKLCEKFIEYITYITYIDFGQQFILFIFITSEKTNSILHCLPCCRIVWPVFT